MRKTRSDYGIDGYCMRKATAEPRLAAAQIILAQIDTQPVLARTAEAARKADPGIWEQLFVGVVLGLGYERLIEIYDIPYSKSAYQDRRMKMLYYMCS